MHFPYQLTNDIVADVGALQLDIYSSKFPGYDTNLPKLGTTAVIVHNMQRHVRAWGHLQA